MRVDSTLSRTKWILFYPQGPRLQVQWHVQGYESQEAGAGVTACVPDTSASSIWEEFNAACENHDAHPEGTSHKEEQLSGFIPIHPAKVESRGCPRLHSFLQSILESADNGMLHGSSSLQPPQHESLWIAFSIEVSAPLFEAT